VNVSVKQVEAIISGIQPGLTMVVGPPGTGKTDTAVQILNVLYHNCPSQRTLIITHSNQALNDLFEKIMQVSFYFNSSQCFVILIFGLKFLVVNVLVHGMKNMERMLMRCINVLAGSCIYNNSYIIDGKRTIEKLLLECRL